MRSRSHRLIWILLLSVLLATGPGASQVLAQGTPTPASDGSSAGGDVATYRAETRLQKSIFGPARGTLVHDEKSIAFAPAGVNVRNFFVKARVTAPYDGADKLWDAGFVFRAGRDTDWRLVVYSDGTWDIRLGSADPLASGEVSGLKTGAGDTNDIELAVDGATGYLAVNREEAGSFDLSRRGVSGDVFLGTTFTENATEPGAEMAYSRFQVWELPDDGAPAVGKDARALMEQGRDLADGEEPIGGPFTGDLSETADSVTINTLGVDVADFYVRAEVANPRDAGEHPFDFGIGFHDTGGDSQYRLVFASDGTWYLRIGVDPVLAADHYTGLKTGAGETNLLEVVASGDTLVFAVNGDVVGTASIADLPQSGDIVLGVGFYPDEDIVEGATTTYTDFTAWSLSAQPAPRTPANASATPTKKAGSPTPTKKAGTPTPTKKAGTPAPTARPETPTPTERAASPAPTKGAATAVSGDPADTFASYLDRLSSLEIVYGPESGSLAHSATAIAYSNAQVDLENFILHVDFTNPYAASDTPWDFGVLFRVGTTEPHLRLIVTSTGDWFLTPSTDNPIQQGTIEGLNLGNGEHNTLDLVVDGDTGYFGINDQFVAQLDLSSVTQSGDIAVATAFFQGNFKQGASTDFKDFVIWSLQAAPSSPEPTTQPTEEATAVPPTEAPTKTPTKTPAKTPTRTPTKAATATPETGGSPVAAGGTYQSPSYGYSVTFDDSWSLVDQSSQSNVDYLRLSNGTSTVDFTSYESSMTPAECLDDELNYYKTTSGYSKAQVALDADNKEMSGTVDGAAWSVYWFTYTPKGGTATDYTEYVECRPIKDGVSLLKIAQFVPFDQYNDQIDARVALLAGVNMGSAPANETPTEQAAPSEPTAGNQTPSPSGQSVIISLAAVDNSNVTALATIDANGDRSTVRVLAVGADDGTIVLIQSGTCSNLSGRPAYLLSPLNGGVSETTIGASLAGLTTQDYVITLHKSVSDLTTPLACGPIAVG